jgi:hypothetical protein
MTTLIFSNNANSTLAGPISNSATTLNVQSGAGAEFPNPSGTQQFTVTMNDAATGLLTEIMYCTARVTDTLTVVRAQEGTVAQSWLAGDLIANVCTAGTMAAMQQTSALQPSRTVTTSGPFTMTTADNGGGVLLNRISSPAASSTTLPVSPGGATYSIADGAGNFFLYNVVVSFPVGTTGPNGETSATLNVNGQVGSFRFFADSNIWSVKL